MTSMRFLIDENLGSGFSDVLTRHKYNALFAGNVARGAPDEEILSFAERENLVIITEDRDFGELIFRLKKPARGVILFRASTTDPKKLFEMVKDNLFKAEGKFIVVKEGQIRVRDLK